MPSYRVQNGFSKKPHPLQLLSYVLFIIKLGIFTVVILPDSGITLGIVFSLVYYSTIIVVLYCGAFCTLVDPTDDVVINVRKAEAKGEQYNTSAYEYYCSMCRSFVQDDSKHCRQCNRCVTGFDHHCKWVNNCISTKNYKTFVVLLVSVAMSIMIFLIAGLVLVVSYRINSNSGPQKLLWYTKNNKTAEILFIICCIFMAIMAVLLVLDLKLLFFHIWLIKNNLTTYKHIMNLRRKDIEKSLHKSTFKGRKNLSNTSKSKVSPFTHNDKETTLNTNTLTLNHYVASQSAFTLDYKQTNRPADIKSHKITSRDDVSTPQLPTKTNRGDEDDDLSNIDTTSAVKIIKEKKENRRHRSYACAEDISTLRIAKSQVQEQNFMKNKEKASRLKSTEQKMNERRRVAKVNTRALHKSQSLSATASLPLETPQDGESGDSPRDDQYLSKLFATDRP